MNGMLKKRPFRVRSWTGDRHERVYHSLSYIFCAYGWRASSPRL